MFSKILVPVDGSKHSDKAVDYAVNLAKKYRAQIILVHVINRAIYAGAPYIAEAVFNQIEEEGKKILATAEQKAKRAGIHARTELLAGDPAEQLLKSAVDNDVEVIVIGSRGLGEAKAFLLGSVSNRISHHAKI